MNSKNQNYDLVLRPKLMVQAIREIQKIVSNSKNVQWNLEQY